MKLRFAWADNDTLEVWTKGERWLPPNWERWHVMPNAKGEYELYAYGKRIFAVQREVAELLVRLLPHDLIG